MSREYDYEWEEVISRKTKGVAEEPYDYFEGSELDELHHSPAWWVIPVFCLVVVLSGRPWPYDLLVGLFIVLGVKAIQFVPLVMTRMLGQYLYD